ncbi:uncharacterized protein [Triticum aestivum]|uniref:uncharacterized protein n=1 Tax=Triticum aestivum TaxID=4565 RepID=UPI001D034B33|nr:uncharacterized protein LOC123041613 [Triticum aestivum]
MQESACQYCKRKSSTRTRRKDCIFFSIAREGKIWENRARCWCLGSDGASIVGIIWCIDCGIVSMKFIQESDYFFILDENASIIGSISSGLCLRDGLFSTFIQRRSGTRDSPSGLTHCFNDDTISRCIINELSTDTIFVSGISFPWYTNDGS